MWTDFLGQTYRASIVHALVSSTTSSTSCPRLAPHLLVLVEHPPSSSWSTTSAPSPLSNWKTKPK